MVVTDFALMAGLCNFFIFVAIKVLQYYLVIQVLFSFYSFFCLYYIIKQFFIFC